MAAVVGAASTTGVTGVQKFRTAIAAGKEYLEKCSALEGQETVKDYVTKQIPLLETKINSISQIQFSHSKADSILREADLLAYDDALKSATKLSSRSDVKLGKVLFISNNNSYNEYGEEGYFTSDPINTYSKAYGGRGFRISPEVIVFNEMSYPNLKF